MANYGEEKVTFGKIAKSQSHYGTTSKASSHLEAFLKHKVQVGDTLQGVAVKYGVTIEQIKRANSLWTNDSLFLREYLLIPVPSDSQQPQYLVDLSDSSDLNCDSVPSLLPSTAVLCQSSSWRPGKVKHLLLADDRSASEVLVSADAATCLPDVNNIDINEYFSKYDRLLVKLKHDVVKMDAKSRQQNDVQ
jgi:LysM repeat protein